MASYITIEGDSDRDVTDEDEERTISLTNLRKRSYD